MVATSVRRIIFFAVLSFAVSITFNPQEARAEKAVTKKVLDNGLTILVKETPPEGLVSIDINIRAGSALEGEYLGSGITHFVEHMVFKGTKTRGLGEIEREIKSYGGFINGSASQDLTNYHVIIRSEYFARALAALKDMLQNAVFDQGEFDKEKEVISNEINLNKDDPERRLIRILNEAAYLVHPYKYQPIGYGDAFASLKRDDLIKYYQRMYVPNRIVIAIAGGVNSSQAVSAVESEFADFRAPDYRAWGLTEAEPGQVAVKTREEPAQINLAYLAMGFHSTDIFSKDLFALDILSMILGRGDNSRLNRVLNKERKLAYSISAWNHTPRDPGLFVITAVLDPDKVLEAESAVLDVIKDIRGGVIGDEELERAKKTALADIVFLRQTVEGEAGDMGRNEVMTGDYGFSDRYIEAMQKVTKDDVKRAADDYLTSSNLTVARILPEAYKAQEKMQSQAAPIAAGRIQKVVISNGLTLLVREDRKSPTVSLMAAMLPGMSIEDASNNGISNLTARMLLKGTSSRKDDQIKGAVERLGGSIISFSGFDSLGVSAAALKDDLPFVVEVLADILINSTFPEEELAKEKALILAAIRDEDDDIFRRGSNALRKELFRGEPYAMRALGEAQSVSSLARNNLLEFYRAYCTASNMVISVSGDFEPARLIGMLTEAFKDMGKGRRASIEIGPRRRPAAGGASAIRMDKDQSLVLVGFETTGIEDSDRYAFDLISSVMSGYSGRLFAQLRDRLSLAYTLGCANREFVGTGYFAFYVATTKERIPEAKKALMDQIRKICEKPVSDEEIALAKRELITDYEIAAQLNDFYATSGALDELYGLGYDNLYRYRTEIEKLTKEDVLRAAKKYLSPGAGSEIIISPE